MSLIQGPVNLNGRLPLVAEVWSMFLLVLMCSLLLKKLFKIVIVLTTKSLSCIFFIYLQESQSCQRSNHGSPIYSCNACNKSYSSKLSLERHRKAQHTDEAFPCSKCNKTFSSQSARRRHEKTCAGTEHVCHKCNKRLSSAYGLRRHMQWHDKVPLKRKKDAPLPPAKRSKPAPVSDGGSCRYRCRRCMETFDLY